MKRIVLVVSALCLVGKINAAVGSAERGVAALTLLQGVPEFLIKDVPEVEKELKTRQTNLSVLKDVIKKQKNAAGENKKKLPITSSMVTSYLALAEFKDVIDIFIYVVEDIFQKKLILPIATILGQTEKDNHYIGKYLNKVRDVLKSASNQLKDFLATQNLIVVLMDPSLDKLNTQRKLLVNPMG